MARLCFIAVRLSLALLLAALLSPRGALAQTCYRGCDARYSACYAACNGGDGCRRQCARERYTCLDACMSGPTELESYVMSLVNAERSAAGLSPLRWNRRLARAARLHATNMAKQERMEHAMDGEGPGERIYRQGYQGHRWAENLAVGWGGGDAPEAAVEWWLGSPLHRANLLSPALTETGVGVRLGRDGKTYYCQTFGTP